MFFAKICCKFLSFFSFFAEKTLVEIYNTHPSVIEYCNNITIAHLQVCQDVTSALTFRVSLSPKWHQVWEAQTPTWRGTKSSTLQFTFSQMASPSGASATKRLGKVSFWSRGQLFLLFYLSFCVCQRHYVFIPNAFSPNACFPTNSQ